MNAANDTALPTTIARGTTYESKTWRAHRYDDHITITSLLNAGKRGKVCPVLTVSGKSDDLEGVAAFVFAAVRDEVSVDGLAAMLADVALAGLRFSRRESRGVDVDAEPKIVVTSDLVDVTFSPRETLARFTAIMGRPKDGSTFRHDTIVGTDGAREARKAYAWAKANSQSVLTMDITAFRQKMSEIGVRLS
jgi:hypothetical protein